MYILFEFLLSDKRAFNHKYYLSDDLLQLAG